MPDAYDRLLDSFASEPPLPPAPAAPEWEQFAPESGSLNIPRAAMPQIKSQHRGALVGYLKGRGITHAQEDVMPSALKPSQAEWSPAKVDKARGFTGPQRSILISADDHVVDGHHQWLKDLEDAPDAPIKAIRLNAPIQHLLIEAARFPSSDVDKSSTLSSVQSGATPAAASQKPPRDAYDELLDGLETSNAPARPARRPASPAAAAGVSPQLDSFINDVIGEASRRSGYTYKIGEGVRTPEQQAQKVAQGVSWTLNSRHLSGRGRDVLAFDERGNYIRDGSHPAYAALGEVYGERAASGPVPVKWGVVNKAGQQIDPGHFELGEADGDFAPAPDEYDAMLDELEQPAQASAEPDEYDRLLDSLADDDPVETVNVDSRNVASPVSTLPPPPSLNPYSPEDRAQRDAAASSRVRAVTVPLSRSLADYGDSSELMADAYREGAKSLNIDPAFAEEWIKNHPGDMRIIGDVNAPDATPADLLGSNVHDERRNTVRLELGGLSQLESDYQAQRSGLGRAADFVTDDTTTAGEKFLDVAAPVVSAAGRAGDLATRPLSATSDALWSLARKHSPTEAAQDAWHKFRTGETNKGAENRIAEQARNSEMLKAANPNLPAMVGGVVEMLTDPANLIPLGVLVRGGAAVRGLKSVQKIERALLASRDARALEFFNSGRRVLKLEAAGDRGFIVALADADGVTHRIDMSAFYADGQKPKLVSRRAGEDIEGVGLERDGDTGRVFHNGRPQDFVMDSETGLRASPVGGANVPETPETLAAQLEAMGAGELPVVDVPAGARVVVPRGMRSFGRPTGGRIIYNPELVERADVIRRMDEGTLQDLAPAPALGERIRKLARDTKDVINITKAIPASFDDSALFGQGAIIAGARPSLIPGAVSDAARSAMSPTRFEAFKKRLVTHPNQDLRESSGLYLGSIKQGEETFGSRFAEKIPGVAASQRAYEATLDSLRSNAFDLYAERLTKAGVTDAKAFKDIASWVNVATGRGELGKLDPLADVLNLPMFSPRLLASKFNILSPVRYARMHPAARKIALTEMFRATGSLSVTMGLAKMAGAAVDLDPFSGGFGTIEHGQTSYDLSGGRLRTLRFAAQLADSFNRERRGESVKDERKPRTLTEKFFRAYLSPAGALAVDAYTGEEFDGTPFEWHAGQLRRIAPIVGREMVDAYRKAGVIGAVKATPAFGGVGVRTRDKQLDPIMPTLSAPVQEELERLGLDLKHLGKDGKKSAAIKPGYKTEGITGDSIRPFGGTTGKPGREAQGMGVDAQATARQLSEELETAIGETINSPDYESLESDDDRAQYLDMIIVNTHKRVMNGVRRDGRGAEMEKEKRVKERLDRMSAKTQGRKNFKL